MANSRIHLCCDDVCMQICNWLVQFSPPDDRLMNGVRRPLICKSLMSTWLHCHLFRHSELTPRTCASSPLFLLSTFPPSFIQHAIGLVYLILSLARTANYGPTMHCATLIPISEYRQPSHAATTEKCINLFCRRVGQTIKVFLRAAGECTVFMRCWYAENTP